MVNQPFIKSPYNYDTKNASDDSAYVETMESLTVQSMAEDADINVIMHRYGITGKMPENPRVPQYGDFTGIKNYQEAMNAVLTAQENFMELPANVRSRFDNDPQKLMDFVTNDNNRAEAKALGLLKEQPHNAANVNNNSTPGANAQTPGGLGTQNQGTANPGTGTGGTPANQ